MTNKMYIAQLGTAFTTDPAISLWTWLKNNWGTATGYTATPDYGNSGSNITKIKFDTKFGDFTGYNFVIVENMSIKVDPQTLGKGRTRTIDTKRLQIFTQGSNPIGTRWSMEQHIDALINGNPSGMQATYGIDEIGISQFTRIADMNEAEMTGRQGKRIITSRSYALVNMIYDKYQL